MLFRGADKDEWDTFKLIFFVCTPIHLAVADGKVGVGLALVAAGAAVSLLCGGTFKRSVLDSVVLVGHPDLVRAVIGRGVDE